MERDDALGVMRLVGRSFRLVYETFGFLFPLGFVPSLAISLLTYLAMGGPSEPMPVDFALSPAFLGTLAVNLVGGVLVVAGMVLMAVNMLRTWRAAGALAPRPVAPPHPAAARA